ncbi:hypothetical protein ACE6H2_010560 [Prunus campanulata]
MATELVKTAEDTYVWHMLVGWSPGMGLRYDGCLLHEDILIGGVQGGEHFEPGLGSEREWSTISCPWRVASAGLVVVAVSATLPIAEGVLVAILPLGVLGTLVVWGGSIMLRWGWAGY